MKKTILLFAGLAFFTLKNQAQTVTDYDGNVYNTVSIGTQVWMKENLKVTHYRSGDAILNVTDNIQWINLTTGAYCNYNNDVNNAITYGSLYNWHTVVDSRNICPTGWHTPTDVEWTTLTNYLGGESVAGGKMKEIGTTHWQSPNTGADNSSGFSGLPGGNRVYDGSGGAFEGIGYHGCWWSSTEYSAISARHRALLYNEAYIYSDYYGKTSGFSVRCVKDFGSGIVDINYMEKIKIYPNPAKDKLNIEFTDNANKIEKLSLFNTLGEIVYAKEGKELDVKIIEIDLSEYKSGIYYLGLKTEDGTLRKKVSIVR